MAEIDPNYASPNIRWALLLEDHPGTTYHFESAAGHLADVPDNWGGGDEHCVCTITFPPESGLEPVRAAKAVAEALEVRRSGKNVILERSSELWSKLCTMTLGRALKRAGYPDDMTELKALMLWRRRLAEVAAVAAGSEPVAALPPAANDQLDAAGRPSEEDAVRDRDVLDLPSTETGPDDGPPADPVVVLLEEIDEAVTAEARDKVAAILGQNSGDLEPVLVELHQTMGGLSRTLQQAVTGRIRKAGLKPAMVANPQDIDEMTLVFAVIGEVEAAAAAASGGGYG